MLAARLAQAGGDEVVVIYNSQVPASKMVAEHYAAARQVPASQLFGFALTTNEIITRADFTDFLQKPLADKLETAGLWKFGELKIPAGSNQLAHTENRVISSKIRYAVVCYGVPLKIAPSSTQDPIAMTMKPELRRDEAAVDSELVWLPLVKMVSHIVGPMPNLFYACTNHALLTPTNGILLVSRLDGPSPEIACGLVDKALMAESNGFWGRAYFDIRNSATNDPLYLGDNWLRIGAEICRELGFDTEMDTNVETFPASYPMSQIAIYAGWYDSDVSGPLALPKVEFMPGAFAYHLHSYSAESIRTANSHWCGPLLAKGATCTMGCVYEPYLQFTPNIAFFLQALGNGSTFAEAAWASEPMLSWQITVIGDPLYQPFNKPLLTMHSQLNRTHNPLIEWSFERLVNLDLLHGLREPKLAGFLENLPATANSAVLTERLANLYDAQGKPSSAVDAWQRALTLNPSTEQRVRIRLVLAKKLLADGRKAEAIEDDNKLLAEVPDYPGRGQVENEVKALEEPVPAAGTPK